MSESQIRTIEQFFELAGQPAGTAALNVALRLGVIDLLGEGQKTVAEIAGHCGLQEAGTGPLMRVLQETGLVESYDEYFALSQAGRMIPRGLWAVMFEQWTQLESALKLAEGEAEEPAFEQQQREEKRRQRFQFVQNQISWTATGIAIKAAEALGAGTQRKSLHLLDLGCGSAIFSMTIAHRDPGCLVKLVDDAAGLARARTTVDSLKAESRVEMIESDDLSLPGHDATFDMVLMADRVHVLEREELKKVLATAARTLVAGGEIVLIDHFPGQERGEVNLSLYELQLLAGTGHGMVTLRELKPLLEEAGFVDIQFTDLPVTPCTHGLVLACKP